MMATFTELRNKAKKYFDAVEKGEKIEIFRHGKPVAMIIPIIQKNLSYWNSVTPVHIEGVSLSKTVLEDRKIAR